MFYSTDTYSNITNVIKKMLSTRCFRKCMYNSNNYNVTIYNAHDNPNWGRGLILNVTFRV